MMHFHVLTLFPEMVSQGLSESILGRAAKKGCIELETVNIRDYTEIEQDLTYHSYQIL